MATSLLSIEEYDINTLNTDGESLLHIACKNGHMNCVKTLAIFYRYINLKENKEAKDTKYLITVERCVLSIQNMHLNTPLHLACYKKNLSIIRLLLEQKCSTIIPNEEGVTAQDIPLNEDGDSLLHIACQWGDMDIVKYLINDESCNPIVRSSTSENTPLHIAAMYGQESTIVQLLSYKECDPNVQNKDGETPLHLAASSNKRAVISKLLAHQQCNINVQNKKGDTPLHLACYKISFDVVKLLLERRCSTIIPNKEGMTAQNIPLNEDGNCLLHIACQWGDVDIVKYLITVERCVLSIQNMHLNTPLHLACYKKNLSIIGLLLEQKCSTIIPNEEGVTAQDIPLNEDGDSLLHIACQWGDVDIVKYLITVERCVLSIQNMHLNTPLHLACYKKNLSIIGLLLEQKCSTIIPNEEGVTAQDIPLNEDGDSLLHIACQWGDVDIVKYLITVERCVLSIQNMHLNTPLHLACYKKNLSIIGLLLEQKCSTIIPNEEGVTAQDIPLNEDGDSLLHIACQWGDVDIVKYLITVERCVLSIQNMHLNTPLHLACYKKNLSIIGLLLEQKCSTIIPNEEGVTAQDIPLNEDGDSLLHIACQWGDMDIVKYLINDESCNPIVRSSTSENTPLHIAAMYGQESTIVQLLSYKECDPNVQNKDGETPLHLAASSNKRAVISKLLAHQQCNINVQNKKGDTPLHLACYKISFDVVKLLLERRCSTIIPNEEGVTPQDIPLDEDGDCLLHIACQWGDVGIVRYLITDERCNPIVQSSTSENTPLHVGVKYGQNDIIVQLLSYTECNPNAQNKEGDTPLHIAVREDRTPGISQLLTSEQCNPNVLNNDHLTPLLIAIKCNNHTAAIALLQHKDCDPNLCDQDGNTPLHLACIVGETHPEMVEVAKQLLISADVDPSCVNNAGQLPIELTTNYELIQAISHMVQCETKQSIQTYINMFIVGNPETGKSTLVQAICLEATSILWRIVPKWMRRVKNVPLHTAGIIPTTFRSKTFGNTVLYDLAGQVEYHTSHAAVIKSTVISTPPAFIVVVNLSESEEKISQALRYWWSFIDNHAARSSAPPQVILVGSHADVVMSTGQNAQEKMTQLSDLLMNFSSTSHFAGQVALDCRDPASNELQQFCSLVKRSCTVLREKADVDLRCHVLYAFLLDRFKDEVACTVSDVATSVQETGALLPQKLESLIPLISTLSDKGLLLLVKGGESHEGWWVILQKQALLGEMNGVIFAPKSFRQHKNLSWSTGVVPFIKVKNEFPDCNPNMVTGFLTHLEICFKIEDYETLSLLKDEAANIEDTSTNVSEEYYFFPALVSVENPLHLWEQNDVMCCKCGWFYECIRPDQFLTTQFLHVLILRLAFNFALKLDPGDCREDSLSLRRKCSVWKHGIAWVNRVPIETVVEVGLQHQSVIVMMRCPKGKEAECVQQRSKIIQKVLEAKGEHCYKIKMSESFVNPTDVNYPFCDNIEDVKLYSLTEIARGIVCEGEEANALDRSGLNPIPAQDLLLFDPCSTDTSTELLRELFSEKHSMDETVRSQVLETLNSECM